MEWTQQDYCFLILTRSKYFNNHLSITFVDINRISWIYLQKYISDFSFNLKNFIFKEWAFWKHRSTFVIQQQRNLQVYFNILNRINGAKGFNKCSSSWQRFNWTKDLYFSGDYYVNILWKTILLCYSNNQKRRTIPQSTTKHLSLYLSNHSQSSSNRCFDMMLTYNTNMNHQRQNGINIQVNHYILTENSLVFSIYVVRNIKRVSNIFFIALSSLFTILLKTSSSIYLSYCFRVF